MSGCRVSVPEIIQDKPCDICGSTKEVDRQIKEAGSDGCVCVDSFFAHGQSNLCHKCKLERWVFFWIDVSGKISYFNNKTQEIKH